MKTCIYTAIAGQHTTLKPAIEIPGVNWIAFLDVNSFIQDGNVGTGWTAARLPERFKHPRMDAKWARMNPEFLLPEYDVTIWIDGSFQIRSPDFVPWVLEAVGRSSYGFALFQHPERDNIYDEYAMSLTHRKYDGERMEEQVAHYKWNGLPADHGLWATGIMGRRKNDVLRSINQQWMNENIVWSWQDQLSLPFVLWKHRSWHCNGYKPEPLPGNIYDSPYFTRVWTGPDR
jgi:hypothetical protein